MPVFSKLSKERLATCHPDIQLLMNEAIEYVDFTVLCGHRGKEEQNQAVAKGASLLQWPKSKHNKKPSGAVDVAPYPINWNDEKRFHELARVIKKLALEMKIPIKWGGDWKKFKDMPHYEIA